MTHALFAHLFGFLFNKKPKPNQTQPTKKKKSAKQQKNLQKPTKPNQTKTDQKGLCYIQQGKAPRG